MSTSGIARSVWRFIERVAASRLGRLLFVVHLIAVACAVGGRPSLAGHPLHYHYESALLKALLLLDLPAMLLAALTLYPLRHVVPALYASPSAAWMDYAFAFVFASIQWWLVGYVLGLAFRRSVK